jgi:hypothetical protein
MNINPRKGSTNSRHRRGARDIDLCLAHLANHHSNNYNIYGSISCNYSLIEKRGC